MGVVDGIPVNSDNVAVFLKTLLESLEILFNHRMQQQQWKAYTKRDVKQTKKESLNFILTSIFEDCDSGNDSNDVDFD